MTIAILGDTHMPKGSRELPEPCLQALATAELIVHTGDFSAASVLVMLEAIGPPVIAVHGNVDEPALVERLPETTEFEQSSSRFALIHDAGPRKGRLERMRRRFPEADAVLFGHSHLPLHETATDGFQIFNPGSPTERRRAPQRSFGIATTDAGGPPRFEHVWLEQT
jgi:putative phosphoesterase